MKRDSWQWTLAHLIQEENETIKRSTETKTIIIATWSITTTEEATVDARDWDIFLTSFYWMFTSCTLAEKKCEEHGHSYEWKEGKSPTSTHMAKSSITSQKFSVPMVVPEFIVDTSPRSDADAASGDRVPTASGDCKQEIPEWPQPFHGGTGIRWFGSSVKSIPPNTEKWLRKLYDKNYNNDTSNEDKHETNYSMNKDTRNMHITWACTESAQSLSHFVHLVSHAPHGSSLSLVTCHPCSCAFLLEFDFLTLYFDLSFTILSLFFLLMHFELHTELDNLIAMQHNLRYSANKEGDEAYDVSASLTGYEPNFMAFS